MLVGGVIEDQVGNDPQATPVSLVEHGFEVIQRAIVGMDAVEIGHVIAIVEQGRGVDGQQPNTVYPQFLQVIELLDQALEITMTIAVAIEEGPGIQLIEDRVFVPGCVCVRDQ